MYRDDNANGSERVKFTGDAWRGYVPIRMTDTLSVQDRLPPRAAAVLISRAHSYGDLFMPIDATEKRLFDAIDGSSALGDIVDRTMTAAERQARPDLARAFFERLWWYDQVVFDASATVSV